MKDLQNRITQILANVSPKYRAWVRAALTEAMSQSLLAEFYMSIVILSDNFNIRIDSTVNVSTLADYYYRRNQITIYPEIVGDKTGKMWDTTNSSDLARILLHEFWHAYLTVLHASNRRLQDLPHYIGTFLGVPIDSVMVDDFDNFEADLVYDAYYLARALNAFISNPNHFFTIYPKLYILFTQSFEKYILKFRPGAISHKAGDHCEDEFQDTLLKLESNERATIIEQDASWIVRKYFGPSAEGCVFDACAGNTEWNSIINKGYHLYWFVVDNLLMSRNAHSFNTFKRSLDHYRSMRFSDAAAKALALGELTALAAEIGPFVIMFRSILRLFSSDYVTHVPPALKSNAFNNIVLLPDEIEKEYDALIAAPYTEQTAEELVATLERNSYNNYDLALVPYPYNNTGSIELTLVREIELHEKTGAPIFIFHAFNPQRKEMGSFTLYGHPIVCRSSGDKLRHNVIATEGIFKDITIDTEQLQEICEELPPDESLLEYSLIAFSMAHGAIRGVRPFIERVMQHNGVDQRTSKLTANVFYYFCYGMFSFMRHYQNNDSLALDEDQVIYQAMVRALYSIFYLLTLTLFSSGIKIGAEYAEKSNYTKTSTGLRVFDKVVMPLSFFAWDVKNAGFETATTGVVLGLSSQKTVEMIGEYSLPTLPEKVLGKKH